MHAADSTLADGNSKQLAVKGIVRSTVWHGVKALCCCLRTKLYSRVVCRMGLQFPASAAAAVPAIYGRLQQLAHTCCNELRSYSHHLACRPELLC